MKAMIINDNLLEVCMYSSFNYAISYYIFIFKGVIVILVPECVRSIHNSPSMYQNFKIVSD